MKILKIKTFKTKLLKFKLLNTKIYRYRNEINYSHLKNIENRLKQILHILYKFHVTNKKILFLGNPSNLNSKIKQFLQKNQHKFLPESLWINGLFTNPKTSFKHLKQQYTITRNRSLKLLLSLRTQTDLIVLLNESTNMTCLNESFSKRIPIISLNSLYSLSNLNKSTYSITGSSNLTIKFTRENVFFLLFHSVLKKAEVLRKKRIKFIKLKLEQERLKQKKRWKKYQKQQKNKVKNKMNHKNNVSKKKK
jgi:hypothetical protein